MACWRRKGLIFFTIVNIFNLKKTWELAAQRMQEGSQQEGEENAAIADDGSGKWYDKTDAKHAEEREDHTEDAEGSGGGPAVCRGGAGQAVARGCGGRVSGLTLCIGSRGASGWPARGRTG